ncbi:VPLPA-CTERM sorting domain-containing protein [Falsirhodobacter xinxiangensis]|uniref:VPLPA-CTERM sorting domain-containing protein n=1 Tax=Falsirhodobacter xinxiangensis TaxID=2530049 RepID=UPI0010A9D3D8|nr:VPLPA-CTERM sorting domain-containing protein [Rhodobacter xinxiangensis]
MTRCCIKCWLVGAATGIVLMLAAVDARADGTPTPYEQVQGLMCPPPVMTLAERAPQFWRGERPTYGAYTPDPRRGLVSVPERPIGGGADEAPPSQVPLPAAGWLLGASIVGLAVGRFTAKRFRRKE